jgi:uncharacterized delta-60 repeat protein
VVGSSRSGLTMSVFGVARFLIDGTPDTRFNGNGKATVEVPGLYNAVARSVAIDAQGRTVIAGYADAGVAPDRKIAVVRLNPDGSVDSSFGSGGFMIHSIMRENFANDVQVQPNGKIVVTGHAINPPVNGNSQHKAFVLRLHANGQLDTSFDGDGVCLLPLPGRSEGVAVQLDSQGRYLVGGISDDRFALARLLPGGQLDTSFAGGAGFDRRGPSHGVRAKSMTVQADGKVVLVGDTQSINMPQALLAMRWNADGTPDPTFAPTEASGGGSALSYHLPGRFERGNAIMIADDGDLVIAGRSGPNATIGSPLLLKYGQPTGVAWSRFHIEDLQRVEIKFNEDLSGSLRDAIQVWNTDTNQEITDTIQLRYEPENIALVRFPEFDRGILPDGNYRIDLLDGVLEDTAGNIAPGYSMEFFVLAGDANRDGRVNLQDFNTLAGNFGSNNGSWAQGDFNYDGVVNLADFNILASRFGTSLTQAASATGSPIDGRTTVDDSHADSLLPESL